MKCPRCKQLGVLITRSKTKKINPKRNYFYSKFYICKNKACKTIMFFDERYRVYIKNGNESGSDTRIGGDFSRNYVNKQEHLRKRFDAYNTRIGSNLSWNQGSRLTTPPWLTDVEYEDEMRLEAIKEQLKPRE